jgi:integrase
LEYVFKAGLDEFSDFFRCCCNPNAEVFWRRILARALPEVRVARLAECHIEQKAGYDHHASHLTSTPDATKNKRFATQNKTTPENTSSDATLNYWLDELATKSDGTRQIYLKNFIVFLTFTEKTADELLVQRQQDQMNTDPKTQRRIESQLIRFIAAKAKEGYSPATLQTYFASVRSFFEIHYCPLKMRRGDYPQGESLGVKAATKETILKALHQKKTRNKAEVTALILFLKDSGLRASDARLLNYGDIKEQLENENEFISITRITQKVKITAKTFLGTEAIHALKEYIKARQHGTRRLPPETLTDKSPLFRTWSLRTVQRIPRNTLSSVIRNAFIRINEPNLSAHSLRKYLQTSLEAAGINANWIDRMLGHRLINSRDAYSKPTDDQLREAYMKAYKFIRVLPETNTPQQQTPSVKTDQPTTKEQYTVKTATNLNEVTQLIADGYEYAATIEGTQLFKKPK